jgi:hypothetical protein
LIQGTKKLNPNIQIQPFLTKFWKKSNQKNEKKKKKPKYRTFRIQCGKLLVPSGAELYEEPNHSYMGCTFPGLIGNGR